MINQPNRSFLQLAGDEVDEMTGGMPKMPKMGSGSENPMALMQALFPNGAGGAAGMMGAEGAAAGGAGGAGAAGAAAGMELLPLLAMLCRAAEATFGTDDPRTNRARYVVNTEWPDWAKHLYRKHMHAAARLIRRYGIARLIAAGFFRIVGHGKPQMKPDGTITEK